MTESKKTHATNADDGTMSCCDTFVHLGGRSLNLEHVVQCLWESDGTVTVHVRGLPDLKLEGADRDLLAEALGLPGANEVTLSRRDVKDRLAVAQAVRLDAAKQKADAVVKAREEQAKAAEAAKKAAAKEEADAHAAELKAAEAKAKADAHAAEQAAKAEAHTSKGHK